MYRTYAYIDGCTLAKRLINRGASMRLSPSTASVFGAETKRETQLLDLVALLTPLLPLDHSLLAIRYYANVVTNLLQSGSSGLSGIKSPLRRHTYFGAQAPAVVQLPCLSPPDPDEYDGEREVPLLVHLLRDGARDAYDAAIVLTDDVTLAEPMEIVTRRLGKRVGLLWSVANNSRVLARASSFTLYLSDAHLAAASNIARRGVA